MKNHKKNARPDAPTSKRAVETGPVSQTAPHLHDHDTTAPPPGQRVSDYLLPGQQNAVPLKQLKELLHMSGRDIRRMIQAERLRGIPILADNQTGYYLPGSADERAKCVKSMRHRAVEVLRAADAIEGAAGLD